MVVNLSHHTILKSIRQKQMITSKSYMLKIMKNCKYSDTLSREEKFQVFVKVCDNMLEAGRMTKATHKRFTHLW